MKKIDIVCIIDKSGSMSSIAKEAIKGFNKFLSDQQKADYEAKMTLLLFDTKFYKPEDNVDVNKIVPLNNKTYIANNCTALYDALGGEIDCYLDKLASIPKKDRCDKTLFVIITDGEENSSHRYHKDLIKLMVEEMREEFKIEFIFLAANQDACFVAESMGMSKDNAFNFNATGEGITIAYNKMSEATTYYATTDVSDNLFQK